MRYAVFRKIPERKNSIDRFGGGFHIEVFNDYQEAKVTKGKLKKIPEHLYNDVQGIIGLFT